MPRKSQDDQQAFHDNGITQVQRGGDNSIEPGAVLGGDVLTIDELSDDAAVPFVNEQLRCDQKRQYHL